MPNPSTPEVIAMTERHAANNYHPLPIVIAEAEGVWVTDPEGRKYMDMLSAYSALNHGHRHPRIIEALKRQADKVTLTSRAFHNDVSGRFYRKLAEYTGKSRILAMNTGAEAVETALKAARRWAYRHKGIPESEAEIIVCSGNFHGRTITITSFSSTASSKEQFGPFTPGFKEVKYGHIGELEGAITPNTAALLIEPIQGEAGVVVPPAGYLAQAAKLCAENEMLFIADEIQTGFGRTGRRFASDWEGVAPDIYVMGKALGGGVMPISAIAANDEVMDVFEPGSHGSTFGGNPLACAVAEAALGALEDERLAERAERLGRYFRDRLGQLDSPLIADIRGRGLLIGLQLHTPARSYCEQLMREGLLCKETHETTIRLAPPLTITEEEIEWAIGRLAKVLQAPMSGKRVAIIRVPFGRGGSMGGAELGPDVLVQAGLLKKLEQLGCRLESHVVDTGGRDGDDGVDRVDGIDGIVGIDDADDIDGVGGRDDGGDGDGMTQTESAAGMKRFGEVRDMSVRVAAAVARAAQDGAFPLVLGGDHSVSIGSLAGLLWQRRKLGVIWIDAHGDCNTEATSPSGNAHGMVLAVAAGLSKYKLTDMPGVQCCIDPARIVLLGARELDEGEKTMIARHGIHCQTVSDIDRMGIHAAAELALALAGDGTDAIHLSLDMDALDPLEAPAVGTPVPGGLTFREVRGALERLGESGRIQSMDIVEVNPLADSHERTALLAAELAASLLGKRQGIGGDRR